MRQVKGKKYHSCSGTSMCLDTKAGGPRVHCGYGVWVRKEKEKGRHQSSGLTPHPALGQEQRVSFQDGVVSKAQQPEGFSALSIDHLLPWPHSPKGLSICLA